LTRAKHGPILPYAPKRDKLRYTLGVTEAELKNLIVEAVERGRARLGTYGKLADAVGVANQHTLKRWRDGDVSEDALKMLRVFDEAGMISPAAPIDVTSQILEAVLRLEAKLTGGHVVMARHSNYTAARPLSQVHATKCPVVGPGQMR